MKLKKIGIYVTLFFCVASGTMYPQQAATVSDSGQSLTQQAPLRWQSDNLNLRPDLNPYNISINPEYGKVEEVIQGAPNSPLIIHIQDAHANFEAQANIKKIIGELVSQYGFSLIQVEGAVSKIDRDAFKPSYLEEANLKLADFLMREGRMTGADAYLVEAGEGVQLYGIEDQLLYLENIRMFKEIYSHQTEVDLYFKNIHDSIDLIGRKLLTPGQIDFTRKSDEFSQNKIDLLDYLVYLNQVAEKTQLNSLNDQKQLKTYPNLVRIMRIRAIEKDLNRNSLKKEGEVLRSEFAKRNLITPEVDQLFSNFESSEKGIKPRDYFSRLTEVATQGKIEFLTYPQIRMFAELLIYQDEINHKEIFDEMHRYRNYLENELFKKSEEKSILELIDFVGLLKQFFKLEMSREKIARYLEFRERIKPSSIMIELDLLAPKAKVEIKEFEGIEKLDSYMDGLEYYYQLVLKRDEVFMEKIMARMKSEKLDKTILVTGGFHKDGLTSHFIKENLSYVVISPKVGTNKNSDNYVKIMLDEDIAVGGVFTGSFATGFRNFADASVSDFKLNFFKAVVAAATNAWTLNELKTIDEKKINDALLRYSERHDQIKLKLFKPGTGIVGNLAIFYLEAVIGREFYIFKGEYDPSSGRVTVTSAKLNKKKDRNQPVPELPKRVGDQKEISRDFDLPKTFHLISDPRLPIDDSNQQTQTEDSVVGVLVPRLGYEEPKPQAPKPAPIEVKKKPTFQNRIANLIPKAPAKPVEVIEQPAPKPKPVVVPLEGDEKRIYDPLHPQKPYEKDITMVGFIDPRGQSEAARSALNAAMDELEMNRKGIVYFYGPAAKFFAIEALGPRPQEPAFQRLVLIDEMSPGDPIKTIDEAYTLATKHVPAPPWMNKRAPGAELVKLEKFMREKVVVLLPGGGGNAGKKFRDAMAERWSETAQVAGVDFEGMKDAAAREAYGDIQIRVLPRISDLANLMKRLGIEIIKTDEKNPHFWQIINSSAIQTLVTKLYDAYRAVSTAA